MRPEEALLRIKTEYSSRLLAGFLGINSAIVRAWYSGRRAIPPRHLATIERYFSTGTFIECRDAEGLFGNCHFEGGLRQDGTRILTQNPKKALR